MASVKYDEAYKYLTGLGVEKNVNKAIECFKIAGEEGDCEAYFQLANIYSDSQYLGKTNMCKSIYFLIKSNTHDFTTRERINDLLEQLDYKYSIMDTNNQLKFVHYINDWIKMTNFDNLKILFRNHRKIFMQRMFDENVIRIQSIEDIEEYKMLVDKYPKFSKKFGYYDLLYQKQGNILFDKMNTIIDAQNVLSIYKLISKNKNYRYNCINRVYKWIAFSYLEGTHDVTQNLNEAINYFKLLDKDSFSNDDYQKIYNYIIKFKSENDINNAYKLSELLVEAPLYYDLHYELSKMNSYNANLEMAKKGDYYSQLNVARSLFEGEGVQQDKALAFKCFKKLFIEHRDQNSFEYLCKYLYEYEDKDAKALLIEGIKLGFFRDDDYFETKNKLLSRYGIINYAKNNYDFVSFNDEILNIEVEKNMIYYITSSYPKNSYKTSLDSGNYQMFQAIKHGYYTYDYAKRKYKYATNFPRKIEKFISKLSGEWAICTVPPHEVSDNLHNNVACILDQCFFDKRFVRIYDLIYRKEEIKARHLDDNKDDRYESYIGTLDIKDKYIVKDKNFIIIDDITTKGTTLISCKVLLKNKGAKNVVCLALGKTTH